MSSNGRFLDYEPVIRAPQGRRAEEGDSPDTELWTRPGQMPDDAGMTSAPAPREIYDTRRKPSRIPAAPPASRVSEGEAWTIKRGHALSYAGLFLFNAVLYFRPYELFPSLSALTSIALWIAIATLVVFLPTQLALEGTLTARPREVGILLLFCLLGLISSPLAISPANAWDTFGFVYIKVVLMFIVMVNVVRTEGRLRGMLLLAIAAGCLVSLSAINDYRVGNFTVEGYRVASNIRNSSIFGDPNEMALYLVTMVPLAIVLLLAGRNPFKKLIYAVCTMVMAAGTIFTFSRGGFLGLLAASAVLGWKLGRRHRLAVVLVLVLAVGVFIVLAPGQFGSRMLTIVDISRDTSGSASTRQAVLYRSIYVALTHPLLGVGMGNFPIVSIRNLVSHNSYTQVAAEIGLPALALYLMFMVVPFRRLRRLEQETFSTRRGSRFYYLSVGLQASLAGYMVSSFFLSVAYSWHVYYLVGYAICLRRLYLYKMVAEGKEVADSAGGRSRESEELAAAPEEVRATADSMSRRQAVLR